MSFVKVSKGQFEQWANTQFKDNWKFALPNRGRELVIVAPLNHGLEFHIYTSCTEEAGETRDIGQDAIRVVLFDKNAGKSAASDKRVNRTEGATTIWNRLDDRLTNLRKFANDLTFCNRCGAHKVERTNRSTGQAFMGCAAYPSCGSQQAVLNKYPLYFEEQESINAATEEAVKTGKPITTAIQKPAKIPETELVPEPDCFSTSVYSHTKFPFPRFNRVQSTIIKNEYWKKDVNLVLGTTTSSGKTVAAELFVGEELAKGNRVVYVSPLKSLTQEKYDEWTERYPDKSIMILTGDYVLTDVKAAKLNDAHIICLTSEMIDSRTRNHQSEKSEWMFDVGLVIVDESHIISTDRGHAVEVGLMRFAELVPAARILCLSATMPNVEDFKLWLSNLNGKVTEVINSAWRPTKLHWHYIPHPSGGSYYTVQAAKRDLALRILQKLPTEKFLIFVHDKNTGRGMVQLLKSKGIDTVFHNADLNLQDRLEIEKSFADKEKGLRVLISTSTLAWGRSLPAKNVIIVGTQRGMNDVDELDILQEAGRAGRSFPPKYIIVTDEAESYAPSTLDNLSLAIVADQSSLHGRASSIIDLTEN